MHLSLCLYSSVERKLSVIYQHGIMGQESHRSRGLEKGVLERPFGGYRSRGLEKAVLESELWGKQRGVLRGE